MNWIKDATLGEIILMVWFLVVAAMSLGAAIYLIVTMPN